MVGDRAKINNIEQRAMPPPDERPVLGLATPAAAPFAAREPIIRTVPQPADMNGNGDIFGGWVLSQMDIAGGTLASRVAHGRVATVAITAMTFVQPIKVGDLVTIYGDVEKVGNTSITIKLETVVQRRLDPTPIRVTEGTFVFVAIDEDGRPRKVRT
jgi:acyl-CoA thioesterase YciA